MRQLGRVGYEDVAGYARQPDGRTFQDGCARYLQPIEPLQALPGDVVSIAFRQRPMHLGFLADYEHGGLSIIHALMAARKVVEHRLDDEWLARVVGWHRIKGVV
jgi:hypothetical protein